MNKTILRLDREISIIILSLIVMLFTFISGYSPIVSLVSFLFVLVKTIIFVVVPFLFFVLEKNDLVFKKIAGIYASYLVINMFVTFIASISIVNGEIVKFWDFIFNLVNLVTLLSSLFILIEQVLIYGKIKNKVYTNTIMKIVYLVGNFVSYPFLTFMNRRDKGED